MKNTPISMLKDDFLHAGAFGLLELAKKFSTMLWIGIQGLRRITDLKEQMPWRIVAEHGAHGRIDPKDASVSRTLKNPEGSVLKKPFELLELNVLSCFKPCKEALFRKHTGVYTIFVPNNLYMLT